MRDPAKHGPDSWNMEPVTGLLDVVIAKEVEAALLMAGEAGTIGPTLRSKKPLSRVACAAS